MPRQSGMADRDPCPWRIVDDVGGAFCMGAIGGGIWHTIKGARMAPKGTRMAGSVSAVRARAPVLGGQFAVWGGLFACCDCTLTAIRQKEDPWNSIMSGATTGGILAARAGPRAMASGFMVGGVLLALIEGMGIMISHWGAAPPPTAADYERAMQQQQLDATAPPTAGGLFPGSGMFGSSASSQQPSGNVPPATTLPPEPQFLETDGVTTFSTESTSGSSSQESGNNGSGSSFWSVFGSSSNKES